MSLREPQPSCALLTFREGLWLDEAAEMALEDYARALAHGQAAEAVREGEPPGLVTGVHLCGLGVSPAQGVRDDLQAFARGLTPPRAGGLGWS